jgi:uncharacterized protein
MRYIYVFLGLLFVAVGAIGVVVPVLPTTPFLLLAAYFLARGSERFHRWFLSTGLYKNHLEEFARSRSMTLKAKVLTQGFASFMLLIAFVVSDSLYLRIFILAVAAYKYYYFAAKIKTIPPAKSYRKEEPPND